MIERSNALTAHYATPPKRRRGPTHIPDEQMERLLVLRTTDPAAFDRLPATVRMAVGHYLETRPADDDGAGGDTPDTA
jgi:hypothetical protein